jgi:hypothetical protein
LQIDLSDWGWKTFGGFAALKAISSQTIASSNSLTSNGYARIPIRKRVYYIILLINFEGAPVQLTVEPSVKGKQLI